MVICAIIVDNYESSYLRRFAIQRVAGIPLVKKIYLLSEKDENFHGCRVTHVQVSASVCKNYNSLMLDGIDDYIDEEFTHFLVFQWDGFPCRYELWEDDFLNYDYVGAPWPVTGCSDDYIVGNGGFSLRSRKLYNLIKKLGIKNDYIEGAAEDVHLCVNQRSVLESAGVRFAPSDLAAKFSRESHFHKNPCFGFHGISNLPFILSIEELALAFNEILARKPSITSPAFSMFWLSCCYERKHISFLRNYFRDPKNQQSVCTILQMDLEGAHGYRPGIFGQFLRSEGILN
jgi:hypothetical protein